MRSVQIALRKRPVDSERVERMVSGIVRRLENMGTAVCDKGRLLPAVIDVTLVTSQFQRLVAVTQATRTVINSARPGIMSPEGTHAPTDARERGGSRGSPCPL